MVSSVNIHSWEKLPKPCTALKEQAFQSFSNILISADLLPMWAISRSESLETCCCLPQAFWELLPCFWLGRPWKTKRKKKEVPFFPGVTQEIRSLPSGCALQSTKGKLTAHDDIWTFCHCCESLSDEPCSFRLGTLKALPANKLGVKGTLFILGTERIWV